LIGTVNDSRLSSRRAAVGLDLTGLSQRDHGLGFAPGVPRGFVPGRESGF